MVAENFRPGVMEKLGLGYEALKARKPGLIYASASGYGPDGPYVDKPGQDLLAQALFGMMAITGQAATGPRPAGASVIDHHGAALFAMGILAAIVRRQRTGQGCRVDASLMQSALDLQAESLVAWLNAPAKRPVNAFNHVAGWYLRRPLRGLCHQGRASRAVAVALCASGRGDGRAASRELLERGQLDASRTRSRALIAECPEDGDDGRVGGAAGAAQDLARAGAGLCRDRRRPAGGAHEIAGDGARARARRARR